MNSGGYDCGVDVVAANLDAGGQCAQRFAIGGVEIHETSCSRAIRHGEKVQEPSGPRGFRIKSLKFGGPDAQCRSTTIFRISNHIGLPSRLPFQFEIRSIEWWK